MKYLTLLLLVSCAYQPSKSYIQTTRYRVVGVKCAQGYYYSYEYNACVKENYVSAQDNPSGVSIDTTSSYKKTDGKKVKINRVIKQKANKPKNAVNCDFVLSNINKCMT